MDFIYPVLMLITLGAAGKAALKMVRALSES